MDLGAPGTAPMFEVALLPPLRAGGAEDAELLLPPTGGLSNGVAAALLPPLANAAACCATYDGAEPKVPGGIILRIPSV